MSLRDICQSCSTEHKAVSTVSAQSHRLTGANRKQKHLQKLNEQGSQAHQKTKLTANMQMG